MDDYQKFTATTALTHTWSNDLTYPVLGLVGEAGEVAEKMKKTLRDHQGVWSPDRAVELAKELGDVLWYIARIAHILNVPLSAIAELNIAKLQHRQRRQQLSGSGDNR